MPHGSVVHRQRQLLSVTFVVKTQLFLQHSKFCLYTGKHSDTVDDIIDLQNIRLDQTQTFSYLQCRMRTKV